MRRRDAAACGARAGRACRSYSWPRAPPSMVVFMGSMLPAGPSAGVVEADVAVRGPHDAHEVTLRAHRPTGDAGPIRGAPRGAGPRLPVYVATSPDGTAAGFFAARFGLAAGSGASDATPSVAVRAGSSGAVL